MHSITIVGGGLAGLTLGVALRQRGVPVELWEAHRYPRHRVCGEFISGQGNAVLHALGLAGRVGHPAGRPAETIAVVTPQQPSPPIYRLPAPALCIPRYTLDATLATQFQELGGHLRAGQRWTGSPTHQGIVLATGRILAPSARRPRWIGIKAHAQGVSLRADLELHVLATGYVGLCRLSGGIVNVCGLFRVDRAASGLATAWRSWLSGPPHTTLHRVLHGAVYDPRTFCSVTGLMPACRVVSVRGECRIGDALWMIAPLAGNGMSVAFESAQLAVEPLARFAAGSTGWADACASLARASQRAFTPRFRWAHLIHRALTSSWVRPWAQALAASRVVVPALIRRTR